MHDSPTTRPTLLLRVSRAEDDEAWRQFVELYAPMVFQFTRARGLQDADAADVVQEVLWRAADALQRRRYDAARGAFRGWLLTIARHELYDWLSAQGRREQAGGGTTIQQRLSELENRQEEDLWQRAYEERLYAWAAEQVQREVQPKTWAAFRLTTLEEKSGQEAAQSLEMTVAAVYLAKSRVMKRLRELVAEVDDANLLEPPASELRGET